ncbi:hypothetical protein K1719_037467 [Acacia pycnantha]|nr:hypothetical protein K1719_037467 [Acacia pycnantha]
MRSDKARYPFLYRLGSFPSSHFSSTHPPPLCHPDQELLPNQTNNLSNLEEGFILEKLSDLLPISRNIVSSTLLNHPKSEETELNACKSEKELKSVDGFLLPEEKLRGVFLQKLKGQSAIEHALLNTGVDMNVEVLGKVVDSGNLGGEAMVTFFNWASAFSSMPLLEPFVIPLLLEKLSSSLLSAKVDSLKYLKDCSSKYGAERKANHARAIWSSLKDAISTYLEEPFFSSTIQNL